MTLGEDLEDIQITTRWVRATKTGNSSVVAMELRLSCTNPSILDVRQNKEMRIDWLISW